MSWTYIEDKVSRDVQTQGASTYIFLHTSQLYDALVDCALCNQAVHCDLTGLSQSVSTIHCLRVVGWIPVVIIEDDSVCSRQVYTQTARTGTKQEDENIWPAITSMVGRVVAIARGQTESASP